MTAIDDPKRLGVLEETGLLDQAPAPALDRYVRIAKTALGAPTVLVSLVDRDRQFFSSQCGLGEPLATQRQTPLSHSFCKHVVLSEEPLVVSDARVDPLVQDNLAIRDFGVVAYAGFPIVVDSAVVGSFCAIDTAPRSWTGKDLAILQEFAEAVGDETSFRRKIRLSRRTGNDLRVALDLCAVGVKRLREGDLQPEAKQVLDEVESTLRDARTIAADLGTQPVE